MGFAAKNARRDSTGAEDPLEMPAPAALTQAALAQAALAQAALARPAALGLVKARRSRRPRPVAVNGRRALAEGCRSG